MSRKMWRVWGVALWAFFWFLLQIPLSAIRLSIPPHSDTGPKKRIHKTRNLLRRKKKTSLYIKFSASFFFQPPPSGAELSALCWKNAEDSRERREHLYFGAPKTSSHFSDLQAAFDPDSVGGTRIDGNFFFWQNANCLPIGWLSWGRCPVKWGSANFECFTLHRLPSLSPLPLPPPPSLPSISSLWMLARARM